MSTKKRFSIATELAHGLRTSMQSATTNQGQLHYDMMPLEIIERDPKNPRKLAITLDELQNGVNQDDHKYAQKLRERENLYDLCESIKRIGVRNALEVYKDGTKYRLITGERRYLAAILAEQKSVPVRINQKPTEFNLRYTQWVENINRQDLSLWEKFNNLQLIAESYKKESQEFNEKILQQLLGVSPVQAYRYFCLLNADNKIINLVQIGKLNNVKLVQELVAMKDKSACNRILSWITAAKAEVTSLTHYREAINKTKNRGKSQAIDLGKIYNKQAAKQMIETLLADTKYQKFNIFFSQLDWNSTDAINRAFKNFFRNIEKESNTQENI